MRVYILAIAAAVVATPTFGAGYYNMPTSLPQCLGMGFGPGYHAPLVLGPMMKAGVAAQPVERVPAALSPPVDCGFDSPTFWSEAPPVEHWHGPMHAQAPYGVGSGILTRAVVTASAIAPMTHGSGFAGGIRVLPATTPTAR